MKRPDITPGPLQLTKCAENTWNVSGHVLRKGETVEQAVGMFRAEQDAIAFAALPDLLDALEKVLGTYPEHMPNPNDNYSPCRCSSCNTVRMARAALTKAGYTFD